MALPLQRSPEITSELKMKQNFFRSLFKNMVVIGSKLPNNFRLEMEEAQRTKGIQKHKTQSRENNFWTTEEDQRLIDLVSAKGRCWVEIAKQMKNRTNKQCRDRYLNTLDPTMKSDDFSIDEDDFIYLKYIQEGPRWSRISKELNRSENQVKNRFYTHIRSQQIAEQHMEVEQQTNEQRKSNYEEYSSEHVFYQKQTIPRIKEEI